MKPLDPRSRFVVRFLATIVVLYVIVALKPVDRTVIVPFTMMLTEASGALLRLVGEGVEVAGTIIRSSNFAVDVQNGCNGIEALLLLVSAIVAFPSTAKARLVGIAIGFIVVQGLNLVRIASLYWLGAHHRSLFDLFHTSVWQSLIILVSVAFFLVWSWKFAPSPVAETR